MRDDEHNMSLPIIKNPRDIQLQEDLATANRRGSGNTNSKYSKTPDKIPMKDTIGSATTATSQ
jgi:hypothetical protein